MSLHSKIMLVPAIGAALLIAGCGGSSHNTNVTGGQAQDVGTEITANVLQNLGAAFRAGVEPTPAPAVRAAVSTNPTCTSTGSNSEDCTYATTQFDCLGAGTFTVSGTFSDTLNTTTLIDTVNLTGMTIVPTNCSSDNVLLVTGDPNIKVAGTGIRVDENTGNVQLPFTITEKGTVSFAPGSAAPTGFPSGHCDVNATATYQTTSTTACTTDSPCLVTAAVSGSVCGKTIPANTVITIGDFPSTT